MKLARQAASDLPTASHDLEAGFLTAYTTAAGNMDDRRRDDARMRLQPQHRSGLPASDLPEDFLSYVRHQHVEFPRARQRKDFAA